MAAQSGGIGGRKLPHQRRSVGEPVKLPLESGGKDLRIVGHHQQKTPLRSLPDHHQRLAQLMDRGCGNGNRAAFFFEQLSGFRLTFFQKGKRAFCNIYHLKSIRFKWQNKIQTV